MRKCWPDQFLLRVGGLFSRSRYNPLKPVKCLTRNSKIAFLLSASFCIVDDDDHHHCYNNNNNFYFLLLILYCFYNFCYYLGKAVAIDREKEITIPLPKKDLGAFKE